MCEEGSGLFGTTDFRFAIESFGVRVGFETDTRELHEETKKMVENALVGRFRLLRENSEVDHVFKIRPDAEGTLYLLHNGEQVSFDKPTARFFKFFDSILRITVAEHAVGWVFLHAGVVAIRDRAIVLPANSFRGKTTLVTELVKAGALYYSDEYAVIDAHGRIHPFPRKLSVRHVVDGEVKEDSVPIEEYGGIAGTDPIPLGLLVLTEYVEGATWKPEKLTPGQGILEVIPHTIPRNINAEFSLKVLNTAVSDAIILRSPRGDAAELALQLLSII